jgi:clan AA aspartic protease (TIGR02281 family)
MKTHFLRTAAIALLTLTTLFPSTARIAIAAPEVPFFPMASAVQQAQKIRVPLRLSPGGTFYVSVEIDGLVTIDMMLDSGAADVAITEEVFRSLGPGVVRFGEREYSMANGTISRRALFKIKSLKIGDLVLEDVTASVGPGALLLGQTFLQRLSSWAIDNAEHVLILEAKAPNPGLSPPEPAQPRSVTTTRETREPQAQPTPLPPLETRLRQLFDPPKEPPELVQPRAVKTTRVAPDPPQARPVETTPSGPDLKHKESKETAVDSYGCHGDQACMKIAGQTRCDAGCQQACKANRFDYAMCFKVWGPKIEFFRRNHGSR